MPFQITDTWLEDEHQTCSADRRTTLGSQAHWRHRGLAGAQSNVLIWYVKQPTLHVIPVCSRGGSNWGWVCNVIMELTSADITCALYDHIILSVIIWHSNIQYQIATTKQDRSSMLHFSYFAVSLNQFHDHTWHKIFTIVIINSVLGNKVSINWVITFNSSHRTL